MLVALKALSIITCHGGEAERLAVAQSTSGAVLRLAARVGETDTLFAHCITVLSHSCMLLPDKRKAAVRAFRLKPRGTRTEPSQGIDSCTPRDLRQGVSVFVSR